LDHFITDTGTKYAMNLMDDEDRESHLRYSLQRLDDQAPEGEEHLKHCAVCTWCPELNLAEVTALKGNFWKVCGFSRNNRNYLYPEETLYLLEKSRLLVKLADTIIQIPTLYQQVLGAISLPCYLVYAKLKNLDYICRRHSEHVRCFSCDTDIYDFLVANPTVTLLDCLVSFDVFIPSSKFVKRLASSTTATAYIVITNGRQTFSPQVMIKLLEEAGDIPVTFAVYLPSGSIILEEFTNALQAIQWKSVENDVDSNESRI